MNDWVKIKSLQKHIEYLEGLEITYSRNIMISNLKNDIESLGNKRLKLKFVKLHMNIDIYKIIWKDLYGHMTRLSSTMNENSVVDFDMLDVWRAMKFNIKRDLKAHGVLKSFRKNKDSNLKTYLNPLFWLKNRVYPGKILINEFAEINKNIYNTNL